jgi:hypothetical protein
LSTSLCSSESPTSSGAALHDLCGKDFDPVMVCSECGEPLMAKQVNVHRGPGAKSTRHLPLGGDSRAPAVLRKEKVTS